MGVGTTSLETRKINIHTLFYKIELSFKETRKFGLSTVNETQSWKGGLSEVITTSI